MNLQQQEQFYQMMTSRAASTKYVRVTEMINGILVSKAASSKKESEPVVIDLQEYAKSRKGVSSNVSVQGVNKLREIYDFIRSNGRI